MISNRILVYVLFSIAITALSAQQDTISIDFGSSSLQSSIPWNNVSNVNSGTATQLMTNVGSITPFEVMVTDTFNGVNQTGNDPSLALNIPNSAGNDSFFGSMVPAVGGVHPNAGITFFHLDTARTYSFGMFASRNATDNRETRYLIEGMTVDSAFLDVASNTQNMVWITGIKPKADSTIRLNATAGPNNTNTSGYYYLGALKMTYDGPSISGPKALTLLDPDGGELWEVGATPHVSWNAENIGGVNIEYSDDNGNSWINVASNISGISGSYDWNIPNTVSSSCLVRIFDSSDPSIGDSSSLNFQIVPNDTNDFHIVVLGSSTAAGVGPSVQDSAWVWRYEEFISQKDTRFSLTNLAVGGFTTYSILPTGTSIPAGVNQTVQVNNNVTKALSLNPQAIIINLPSNDAANSFPVTDQLANYALIMSKLDSASIPTWVATPQPRNNFNAGQVQIQLDMVDSTFAIFGNKAIDFWNGLQNSSNGVDNAYNSGDGVHLNDAGHLLLFQRVVGENLCVELLNSSVDLPQVEDAGRTHVYPNPTNGMLVIEGIGPSYFTVTDLSGKNLKSGISNGTINISDLNEGVLLLRIEHETGILVKRIVLQH